MGEVVDLIIDPVAREKVPIELPLSFRVDPAEARRALGIGDFVDLSDLLVAKAIALAYWAGQESPPVPLAFFGGVAHRMLSPSSNDPASGLRRSLHDLDLVGLHRLLRPTLEFLKSLGHRGGSALTFLETPGDRIFNALGGGRRYRFHDIRTPAPGELVLGSIDFLADEFRFCHVLDLRDDVEHAPARGWTLSASLLLLAKLQFIQRVPAQDVATVQDRVLEPFGKRSVLIGLEAKDARDVLALLADLPYGSGPGEYPRSTLKDRVSSDWGLWRTVGLNVAMLRRSKLLRDVPEAVRQRAEPRLAELEELIRSTEPKRRFAFLKGQWWQDVDAPPVTDTTVSTGQP